MTDKKTGQDKLHYMPVLPLRDVVVFPQTVISLFVGREASMNALEHAMESGKQIFLVAQKEANLEEPKIEDIYEVGCIATILQMLKLPDGTIKVLVEGEKRAVADEYNENESHLMAGVELLSETVGATDKELEVATRTVTDLFEKYVKLNRKVPPELLSTLSGIENASRFADTVSAHIAVRLEDRQHLLELGNVMDRFETLIGLVEGEIDVMQIEKKIRGRVKTQMEKSQREYYLNEQMKAIQRELGDLDEVPNEDEDLSVKVEKAGMPKAAKKKALSELNKLKMMSPMSAEATVVRNYIDVMLGVPWKKRTKVTVDIEKAKKILDKDHYGLEKVKERILEYLAVQQRVKNLKGAILCLVGPPGVGKTSLGKSIAEATNRKFVRMSLGGVRDEAEIRGHRRTYIGSMPGRIVQNLSKVGSKNPLYVLDELDKMSMDFRGDPSSALLEVLDPEQNHAFNDHYLEVDMDLSEVMFVATANSLNIPGPLLDRMEVIRIPGYTEDEKLVICQRYLVPKQLEVNGVKEGELNISEGAIRDVIRYYTREAGVRNLERVIAKIARKVVKEILLKKRKAPVHVTARNINRYLGVKQFHYGLAADQNLVGQVTGLAWTEVGGDLLTLEASVVQGKGKLLYTGQLGDVMQESIQAAMTVVRSRAETLGLEPEFHQKVDVHIHVPEGATPKDGPSAGTGMCTALVSALTGTKVRADVAMTGEITLRGKVLPIGGLKEKMLAAHRGGIRTVIIPFENEKDIKDMPANVLKDITIKPVKWIDEVLELALESMPKPFATKKHPKSKKTKPAKQKENEATIAH
ncbi:MAG: endopeptidase La [bacterium]